MGGGFDNKTQTGTGHTWQPPVPGAVPATATAPGAAPDDLKQKYQTEAYARLGLDAQEFATMDPMERNALINAAYARMYKSDPEVMKWAGMGAMASDLVGSGMIQSYALKAGELDPMLQFGMDQAGMPSADQMKGLLAKGNAGVFDDIYWQHLAFQEGGMAEIEKAYKAGELNLEQLQGWREISAGQGDLSKAKASGNDDAIKKAQEEIWSGNGQLLHNEQAYLQKLVYDGDPNSRGAFQYLSGNANPMGVASPIPDGTSFNEHREGTPGRDDVGDFGQRWNWIQEKMLPEYRAFETNHNGDMQARMDTMISREHEDPLTAKWKDIAKGGVGSGLEYAGRMERKVENFEEEKTEDAVDWFRHDVMGYVDADAAPTIDMPVTESIDDLEPRRQIAYDDPPPAPDPWNVPAGAPAAGAKPGKIDPKALKQGGLEIGKSLLRFASPFMHFAE